MLNSYTSLEQPEDLDTKGWRINFDQVITPKRGISPYIFLMDKFYESDDEKYACLVYTIVEWRMMSYSGLIAIFENKLTPTLIVNPKSEWFSYQGDQTLNFINDLLFLRLTAYSPIKIFSGTPFIVIALKTKKFGFIDFDFSSGYYSPIHVHGSIYKFKLDAPERYINSKFINRDEETFDITDINFYNIDKLKRARTIYQLEKLKIK